MVLAGHVRAASHLLPRRRLVSPRSRRGDMGVSAAAILRGELKGFLPPQPRRQRGQPRPLSASRRSLVASLRHGLALESNRTCAHRLSLPRKGAAERRRPRP
jgi:hypothetical protein